MKLKLIPFLGLLLVMACGGVNKSTGTQVPTSSTLNTLGKSQTWQLVAMRGKAVPSATTLVFNPEAGTLGGFAACNNYFCTYNAKLTASDADGDHYALTVKLEGGGSIGCPEAVMNAEARYLALLGKADGMLVTAYTLTLTQRGKEILKYELQ